MWSDRCRKMYGFVTDVVLLRVEAGGVGVLACILGHPLGLSGRWWCQEPSMGACVSTIVLGQPARCPFMVFNSSNQHLLPPGVRSPACKPQQTEPQQTETSSRPAECRRCSLCRAAATIFRGQCCCPGPCTALTASALPRSPTVPLMCGFLFSS